MTYGMGRPPLPKDQKRTFVSVGFRPEIMAALRIYQRRLGVSSTSEAVRVAITRALVAEELINPDAPPPKRKSR